MFYIIVLSIAVVILILFLTFMGIMMRHQNAKAVYPPTTSICPDYWKADDSGNCIMPTQTSSTNKTIFINSGGKNNLGTNPNIAPYSKDTKSFSINNVLWSSGGKSVLCAQKDWSMENNIIWDGISNYNGCQSS